MFLKVGVTKYRAWRQNLSETLRGREGGLPRALYQNRQNPSDDICLGKNCQSKRHFKRLPRSRQKYQTYIKMGPGGGGPPSPGSSWIYPLTLFPSLFRGFFWIDIFKPNDPKEISVPLFARPLFLPFCCFLYFVLFG